MRILKQLLSSQNGQALPIVLALLAIGGLTIATNLNYATTGLIGSRIVEEKIEGIYAAGAGVEHALWSLGRDEEPPVQLSENISGMEVGIQKEDLGTFTMYLGELTVPNAQYWKLNVSGNISWVEDNRYKYVITVTSTANQTIYLEEVGARIPIGYNYEDNSTTRSDNVTVPNPPPPYNPVITQDEQEAKLLNWTWKNWHSNLRPNFANAGDVYTQTFYVTGTGSVGGAHAWVEGDPAIIGVVGEITGTRYRITATATRPENGRTTAEITAGIIVSEGTSTIMSWQISN
ncbi:hypothetical protein ACFLUJ_07615 [Chloroflexota bacterium]